MEPCCIKHGRALTSATNYVIFFFFAQVEIAFSGQLAPPQANLFLPIDFVCSRTVGYYLVQLCVSSCFSSSSSPVSAIETHSLLGSRNTPFSLCGSSTCPQPPKNLLHQIIPCYLQWFPVAARIFKSSRPPARPPMT